MKRALDGRPAMVDPGPLPGDIVDFSKAPADDDQK